MRQHTSELVAKFQNGGRIFISNRSSNNSPSVQGFEVYQKLPMFSKARLSIRRLESSMMEFTSLYGSMDGSLPIACTTPILRVILAAAP